jgi:hypothetical protein
MSDIHIYIEREQPVKVITLEPSGKRGPAGATGPAGPAGPNSVTSATTSDGTAELSLESVSIGSGTATATLDVTQLQIINDINEAVVTSSGMVVASYVESGTSQASLTADSIQIGTEGVGSVNIYATGNAEFSGDVTVEGTLTADHIHGNLAGSVYAHVRAGETLAKGDPVYISGSHGSGANLIPIVSKADASNAAKMPAVGIMDAALANNANGHMVIIGTITQLNTNAYAVNSVLYVASGGGFTATPPAANSQAVAIVERSNANNGAVIVKVNGLASSGGNGASDANKLVRFGSAGTIPVASIGGLGTGVATALAVNTGSAGAFVVNGGTATNMVFAGSAAFDSTTRPTSAGTGTPGAASLITATDRRTEEVSDLSNVYYRQIMGHELGVWATVGASPSSVIDGNSRAGCRFIGTTGLSSASAQGGGIKYPDGGITGGSFFSLTLSFDLRFLFRNSLSATIFDVAHFVSLRNNTNFWSAQSIGLYHVPQPAATWAAATAYTVGNRINVSGIVYVCSTAGTSGGSQPTFNATINGTTNDNTAVWRTLGPHTSDKWALAFVDASGNITLTDTGVAWVSGTSNTTALRLRSNGSSVFASVNGSAEVSVSRGSLFGATPYIMCRGESATTSRIAGLIWTVETSNI